MANFKTDLSRRSMLTGAALAVASGVAFTAAPMAQASGVGEAADVKTLGAKGDGSADDTAVIQSALSALAEGTELYFPAGTYLVTAQLSISNKNQWRITGAGAVIMFASLAGSPNGGMSAIQVTGCKQWTIQGLEIQVVTQTQNYNGINITNASSGRVTGNRIINARWAGIGVYDPTPGTSFDLEIDSNTVEYCRFGISTNGKHIRIHGNHIADYWPSTDEATVKGGVWSAPSIYYDAILLNPGSSYCTVAHNTIVQPGQSGVYTADVVNCTISGNTIYNAQNRNIDIGPTSGTCTGLTITGNVCVDGGTGNISLAATSKSSVTGNTTVYTGSTAHCGIALNGECCAIAMVGNSVDQGQSPSPGIFVNNSTRASTGNAIVGNTVVGSSSYSVNTTPARGNILIDPGLSVALSSLSLTSLVRPQREFSLAMDGTTTFDAKLGDNQLTLHANCTDSSIINPIAPGQEFSIAIVQDATGGRAFGWWSQIKWVGGVPPAVDLMPNSQTAVRLRWDGASWRECGRSIGVQSGLHRGSHAIIADGSAIYTTDRFGTKQNVLDDGKGHLQVGAPGSMGARQPKVTNGSCNGTVPPVPGVSGNDARGQLKWGSGRFPRAGAQIVVTFASAYASAPTVMLTSANRATAAQSIYPSSVTRFGFTVSSNAPSASQAVGHYAANYSVVG